MIWNYVPTKVRGRRALWSGVAACRQFLKMIKLSVNRNSSATEVPCMPQTLVIHRRPCKIMILILPAVCVCQRLWAAKSCILWFFFIHLWVISSSCASHMNSCVGKLYFGLHFPLWRMFTIYLWKHCNNKTLYIAFQFAVRADEIFLSQTELHTLGDSVGPAQNNKTLQSQAGAVQTASRTRTHHSADLVSVTSTKWMHKI